MASCKWSCDYQEQIASLRILDITSCSPSQDFSTILSNDQIDSKTLQIRLKTDIAFERKTILILTLLSLVYLNGTVFKLIIPISVQQKVTQLHQKDFCFEFKSDTPSVVNNYNNFPSQLHDIIAYRFLFTFKKNHISPTMFPALPLVCTVRNAVGCSVFCQQQRQPNFVDTPNKNQGRDAALSILQSEQSTLQLKQKKTSDYHSLHTICKQPICTTISDFELIFLPDKSERQSRLEKLFGIQKNQLTTNCKREKIVTDINLLD